MKDWMKNETTYSYSGWCTTCTEEHRLEEGNTREYAKCLMQELETTERIDYKVPNEKADARFSTDYLFGEARGQMFGVLECLDEQGEIHILRAFSCQYNSAWLLDGWVPPVFDVHAYDLIMIPGDRQIKELGRQIDLLRDGDPAKKELTLQRKQLSQRLMKELHALYMLHNFHGATMAMTDLFPPQKGIPTGAGDCCAPKLLNYAAQNYLKPVGLLEFYWGKDNRSGTGRHGHFYSSCLEKCHPILGFMLCGVGG